MQQTTKRRIGRVAIMAVALGVAGATAPVAANAATSPLSPRAAAAQLAPAVPAESPTAVTALQSCDAGNLCFWVNAHYDGARGQVSGDNPDWRAFPQFSCWSTTWNDCASSAVNRGTQCTVHLYRDTNYLGGSISIPRGGSRPNLTIEGFNDDTSSNRWC